MTKAMAVDLRKAFTWTFWFKAGETKRKSRPVVYTWEGGTPGNENAWETAANWGCDGMTAAECEAMRQCFMEDTKPMKKETRKEKRAREKDEELATVLQRVGDLDDALKRLTSRRERAVAEALKLLVPDRAVKVGGHIYWVTGIVNPWLGMKECETLNPTKCLCCGNERTNP